MHSTPKQQNKTHRIANNSVRWQTERYYKSGLKNAEVEKDLNKLLHNMEIKKPNLNC